MFFCIKACIFYLTNDLVAYYKSMSDICNKANRFKIG